MVSEPPLAGRRSASSVVWLVAGALVVAALVFAIIDIVKVPQSKPKHSDAAVLVARTEAINFFTLDYQHAPAQVATLLKLAADPFKSQYAKKQASVISGVVTGKLTSRASVSDNGTAVEYETANTAVVIVAVDGVTSNSTGTSQSNRYRMRLTVNRIKGNWLVTSIEDVN